jgi:exodeoxyribonuclease VII large subunit
MPYLPQRIGVVTSPSGAAIKDILKVLERRFKDVHIILNPVRVQGEGAKEEISQAIKDLNRLNEELPAGKRIEVMIVGRGGGSLEDLWAFNEEVVCRAIYASRIPVISAVGHERDVTIADLVADLRAATPSAAAELVIPKKEDLKEKLNALTRLLKNSFLDATTNFQERIDELAHRLSLNIGHNLELNYSGLSAITKKLTLLNPCLRITQYLAKASDLARQIYVRMSHFIRLRELGVTKAVEKLSGLSPLNILSRGYSITFKMPEHSILKDIKSVKTGDIIKTKIHKGEVTSQIKELT